MVEFTKRYGPWALVTGGGNGLGAEFARQLAAMGVHLVLVDMDAVGLARVAAELTQNVAVQVRTLTLDLTDADFLPLIDQATSDIEIGLLINNAGISALGLFQQKLLSDHLSVVDLNVRVPLSLAYHFLPSMVSRGRGGILFVSSLSALQGTAYVANYAATKAWNLIFAEGLWEETRGTGVDVLGYLVGSTRTPGFIGSQPRLDRAPLVKVMDMAHTVQGALASMGQGPVRVAGRNNWLAASFLSRFLPRKWAIRLVSGTTRALYG